jgi:hypothetical protein
MLTGRAPRPWAGLAVVGAFACASPESVAPPVAIDAVAAPVDVSVAPTTTPPDAAVPSFTIGAPVIVAAPPVVTAVASASAPQSRPTGRVNAASRSAPGKKSATRGVDAVIESHYGDVEACYAPIGLKDPRVAGRIVLQWTLGADGRPSAVAVVQDTLSNPAVGACLKTRARAWQFPPPEGGVGVVRAPFDLRIE